MNSNLDYKPTDISMSAEQFVIGSALIDGKVVFDLKLLPEHFFSKRHQDIWDAILEIIRAGTEPDLLAVLDMLDKKNKLEPGTETYLTQLMTSVPNSSNASYYASLIKKEYKRRQIIFTADRVMKTALNGDIESALLQVAELEQIKYDSDDIPFSEKFTEKEFERISSYKRWRISSLPRFSHFVPLVAGQSILIAGATSQGKSQLALYLAFQILEQGGVVGYYSTEIDHWAVLLRIINYEANTNGQISLYDIDLQNPHWQEVGKAILKTEEKYRRFHFFRDFYRMEEISASIEAHRFDVAIIDYIQHLTFTASRPGTRAEELENIAREVRRLSQRRCMIVLSQFNRSFGDNTQDIDLRWIKGSSGIEQSFSTIVPIRRDESDKSILFYAVAKNQTYGATSDWKKAILLPNGAFKEE